MVEEPAWCSTAELAEALAGWQMRTAAAECRWLEMLAEFDSRAGWCADGQLSGWTGWCGAAA